MANQAMHPIPMLGRVERAFLPSRVLEGGDLVGTAKTELIRDERRGDADFFRPVFFEKWLFKGTTFQHRSISLSFLAKQRSSASVD